MSIKTPLSLILTSLLLLTAAGATSLSAAPIKQAKSKPFLIQGKLPHLTMMVKMMWEDPDLALTPAQKKKLLKIRRETISGAQQLNKEIMNLEDKIVTASNNGANPASLKKDVYKLANLRAEATMLHLKCIFYTRKILTKDQLDILE